jgi:hypothetical protein
VGREGSLSSLTFAHVFCDHGVVQRLHSCAAFTTLVPWANLTLIILFSEMLKFSKNCFFQIKKYCEENSGIFKNISFVEMNV